MPSQSLIVQQALKARRCLARKYHGERAASHGWQRWEDATSSYAFMRFLESSPSRYDRGIRWLSGGHMAEYHERIAEAAGAAEGARILDIGCGTGGVALECARRGAQAIGIDINPGMLDIARAKTPAGVAANIEWLELGAAEIEDRFAEHSFDAVVACLVLSEMSADEVAYTLRMVYERLVPGGRLVVGDEVQPSSRLGRLWHRLRRFPLAAVTWLLTQVSTRPLANLTDRIRRAGFVDVCEERPFSDAFAIVTATTPAEET